MNSRPVVRPHPAPQLVSADSSLEMPRVADASQKTWQIDEPNELPAPVIRANMISFRRTYQGRVKVAFFEHD